MGRKAHFMLISQEAVSLGRREELKKAGVAVVEMRQLLNLSLQQEVAHV